MDTVTTIEGHKTVTLKYRHLNCESTLGDRLLMDY